MESGKKAFSKGAKWELYIEDLVSKYFDFEEMKERYLWVVEGLWQMDVTFNEGDFREIEFVQEPVAAPAAVRMGINGKDDLYENIHITSFVLRKYSATLCMDSEEAYFDAFPYVVLNDNSQIAFISYYAGDYIAEKPIVLDQVSYVVLPDGTKLPMPGTGDGT